MAGAYGTNSGAAKARARAYTPPMSQGWVPLGFTTLKARASLPAQAAVGDQDVRTPNPIPASQINQVTPTNFQGIQLRQYQCLLSRRWNIATSATFMAEQKQQYYQLATNKTGTGLGQGKLKNLNVNASTNFTNLLARATSFGRFQNKVPVQ